MVTRCIRDAAFLDENARKKLLLLFFQFFQACFGRFGDDAGLDCFHYVLDGGLGVLQLLFQIAEVRFRNDFVAVLHYQIGHPLYVFILCDTRLQTGNYQRFYEVLSHGLLPASMLLGIVFTAIIVIHRSIPAGARGADHWIEAIAAEQFARQHVLHVITPPPGIDYAPQCFIPLFCSFK